MLRAGLEGPLILHVAIAASWQSLSVPSIGGFRSMQPAAPSVSEGRLDLVASPTDGIIITGMKDCDNFGHEAKIQTYYSERST